MNADLKPCPNPECRSEEVTVRWGYWVQCAVCGTDGPIAGGRVGSSPPDDTEAIRLWNLLPRVER